jgi:hypothetical protein
MFEGFVLVFFSVRSVPRIVSRPALKLNSIALRSSSSARLCPRCRRRLRRRSTIMLAVPPLSNGSCVLPPLNQNYCHERDGWVAYQPDFDAGRRNQAFDLVAPAAGAGHSSANAASAEIPSARCGR